MSHAGSKSPYCGMVLALMSTATVEAQEAPADNAAVLEEIKVTATRTVTDLQSTPIAVTALSADALSEGNVKSILDVTNFVPSLSVGTRSGNTTSSASVSIRGMGVDAVGSSPAVGIYIDDVYFASGLSYLFTMLDVDQVEVLRGPQGTLFGRNTIAGAIQILTRDPGQTFNGYLTASGGNDSSASFQGAVNIPVTDTFAVRIAGAVDTRGGYVRDLYADTLRGADRTEAARLKARWTPNDRLTVDLEASYLEDRTNGRAVLVSAVNPNAEFVGLAQLFGETRPLDSRYLSPNRTTSAGFNSPDYYHFYYDGTKASVKYSVGDSLDIKSVTSWSSYRNRIAADLDDTPLAILSDLPAHDDTRVITEELQLVGRALSNRLNWTTGLYFYDSNEKQNPGNGIVLGFGPASYPYGNPESDIVSKAVYGQATYDLTDSWSLTAGLRYSHESTTAWEMGLSAPDEQSFSDTSPYAGVNFQVTDNVMLYAKASKGFRAGGLTPSAVLPGGGLGFAPETAWTYEAGARMEFLERRLRVNPTIFYTNWKSIQFNSLIPTATTVVPVTQNAGDAHIKGFELESQFAATNRLTLTGSMSLLDSHYARVDNLTQAIYPYGFLASLAGVPGSVVILPNIALNTPLQRAPKEKVSIGGRYAYPLFSDSQLVTSVDYAWTAKQYSAVTIGDTVELPSYGVLNGRLEYQSAGDRWSIALYGTNLTNKFYLVGGTNFGWTTGATELDPARPREYGVEGKVKF